ncbi:Uncharacterized protein BM_BM435 [Brugia malayi]|uniref:Bm435 n=2 Tax=Brugia malayi TaxID=6279 RepID=A0A0K0JE89_BRUMA|nr:Uncharacterized protein BM_BM435 [Brugia malayi]CDP95186.1 Bm435 [Brugia malayi]VIO92064.1 Uncharacterized protein BM_BM435 [Brugia malayi]
MSPLIAILCLITLLVDSQMLPFTIQLPLQKNRIYQDKVQLKETQTMKGSIYKDTFKLEQNY